MQSDAGIDGEGQGKNHEKPIGRIKNGRLEIPEKGRAAKQLGVPKGQMSLAKFLKSELTPADKSCVMSSGYFG